MFGAGQQKQLQTGHQHAGRCVLPGWPARRRRTRAGALPASSACVCIATERVLGGTVLCAGCGRRRDEVDGVGTY